MLFVLLVAVFIDVTSSRFVSINFVSMNCI